MEDRERDNGHNGDAEQPENSAFQQHDFLLTLRVDSDEKTLRVIEGSRSTSVRTNAVTVREDVEKFAAALAELNLHGSRRIQADLLGAYYSAEARVSSR